MPPESEGLDLTNYIFDYYRSLFTPLESEALWFALTEAKRDYFKKNPHPRNPFPRDVSHKPEVRRLLADGMPAFRRRVRDRIVAEHAGQIFLNRCPMCEALARTPTACVCPSCNFTWFHRREELRALDQARLSLRA